MKVALMPMLGLLTTLAVCSCADSTHGGGEPTGETCPTGSTLTYGNFGKEFMSNYCIRCHSSSLSGSARQGAPSDHNFDTLEGIRDTNVEHIDEVAAASANQVNTMMPPSGPRPSLEERQQLGEWLACGTP